MDGYVETGEEIVMALKQTGISMDDKYVVETMEDIVKTMVTAIAEMRITPARRIRRAYAMGLWAGMRIAAKQTQANLAAMKEAEKKPNIIETEN
jgi:sulfopyruvate decarboxylase TPP-binding subunit